MGGSQLEIHFNNGSSGHHHQGGRYQNTQQMLSIRVPRNILLLIHRNSYDSSLHMKIFLATVENSSEYPPLVSRDTWDGWVAEPESPRSPLGSRQVSSSAEAGAGEDGHGDTFWHLATRTTLRHGHRQQHRQLWCDKWHGARREHVMEGHDVRTLTWAPSYYDTLLHIVTRSVHVIGQCKCRSGLGPKSSTDTEQTED